MKKGDIGIYGVLRVKILKVGRSLVLLEVLDSGSKHATSKRLANQYFEKEVS